MSTTITLATSPLSYRRPRPTSAISTTSTIIDHHSSTSPSAHQPSPQTLDDYQHRLELIDANRSKLNLLHSASASAPELLNRPRVTFDDHHPRRLVTIQFLLASSSQPGSSRLLLVFDSHAKVFDLKHRIRSQWPVAWSAEGLAPKSSEEIKLLFLGRFLNDWETLDSLQLAAGSPTTMHLLLRPTSPNPQLTKEDRNRKLMKWNCCWAATPVGADEAAAGCCIIS